MGFNSAFKGLIVKGGVTCRLNNHFTELVNAYRNLIGKYDTTFLHNISMWNLVRKGASF
jgi:hypothetical protein